MKRLDKSEIVFKAISYVLLTLFSIACVYPLLYILLVSVNPREVIELGKVTLNPSRFQFKAFRDIFAGDNAREYWIAYSNTIFYTVYGTAVSMFVAITGAYALSKTRLLFGRGFNFLLVFTMWFSAGMIPTYQNFIKMGIDNKYGYILGLGFNAFNIILLRNFFSSVPHEIEEAATIDGATEFQLLTKIYMPMSKSSIATVTMFYALSRWNGYFWAMLLLGARNEKPLQVVMKNWVERPPFDEDSFNLPYAVTSFQYAMIICSIIPILIVYPQMQKYFAAGVNVGGVKE